MLNMPHLLAASFGLVGGDQSLAELPQNFLRNGAFPVGDAPVGNRSDGLRIFRRLKQPGLMSLYCSKATRSTTAAWTL